MPAAVGGLLAAGDGADEGPVAVSAPILETEFSSQAKFLTILDVVSI